MDFGKLLKDIAIKGGPAIIALSLGSPEMAAVLATASASADGVKIGGKAIEKKTGWSPHKVAAPAAAMAGSAVAMAAVGNDIPGQICALAGRVCQDPTMLATIPGVAMVLWQVLAQGASRLPPERTAIAPAPEDDEPDSLRSSGGSGGA